MTALEDVKVKLHKAIVEGDIEGAVESAKALVDADVDVLQIVSEVLAPAMKVVGEMYERGEYFIADLIASAEAFRQAFEDVLKPKLTSSRSGKGVVAVFGTVRGDIHELGKNIAKALFKAEGFEVIDLGVDVPPEKFAEAVEAYGAKVVGASALMTTTMVEQKKVVEELRRRGLRDKVVVVVGGAPVTEEWVKEVGADVCGDDAFKALKKVKELLGVV
ncbi:MAG: methyltransferase [Zestosphaera tikiterensis]|uniref:Methyltransferase n=1 Tax=Zestosphaera tikiterensis TaxID=1973259 RepID=A0A2R7Y2E5_9CREN|nr:MAG: methyltransferase [Zestosphaera tikiterensis]